MISDEIRGLLVFACVALLLGVAIGPATAGSSAPSENPTERELPVDHLEEVQDETVSQQNVSLEQDAREGVQEGLAYLERSGINVSEEYRRAVLEGATSAATALASREDTVSPETVRLSAYGATVGALQQTAVQTPAAVPNSSETRIDPNATSEIVLGAMYGTTDAATQTKSDPGDVQPTAVINAAYGAAVGSTLAILDQPTVADLASEAALGASSGALQSARNIGNSFPGNPAAVAPVDPQPYIDRSALGAARGALAGVGERLEGDQPVKDGEVVVAASAAAYNGVSEAIRNRWSPDQAYEYAYNASFQDVTSSQYARPSQ